MIDHSLSQTLVLNVYLCSVRMSRSKTKSPSAAYQQSTTGDENKKSYLNMYFLAVAMLLFACLAVYARAISSITTPSSNNGSHRHSVCGDKDLWRAKTTAAAATVADDTGLVAVPASWGSLRPGVYFGMKTKSEPTFLSTGTLWSEGNSIYSRNFRHAVHTDEIDHFEWLRNNGRTFGIEQLRDTKAQLLFNATFVIDSDVFPEIDATRQVQWRQHFSLKRPSPPRKRKNPSVTPDAAPLLSFIHYFGMDCDAPDNQPLCFHLGKDIRDIAVQVDTPAESPEKGVELAVTVKVTGYSSLSGWFALTYTATPTDNENFLPLQVSFYGPKAKRKKGGSGIPLTIEKIHRAKDFLNAQSKKSNRRTKALAPSSDEGILFNESSGDLPNLVEPNAVGVFVQFLSASPLEIHVEYSSHLQWDSREEVQKGTARAVESNRKEFFATVQSLVEKFDRQFEERFHIGGNQDHGDDTSAAAAASASSFSEEHVEVARRAMSGLLGGLGYFHGSPRTGDALSYDRRAVHGADTNVDAASPPPNVLTLFSGTPSRSSFPRGFLWDEGFHQMLMNNWDPYLTMEVLTSWMGCMMRVEEKMEGQCRGAWIPRELILGQEAFKVVPDEFVTQRVDIANPPTLLIVVEKLIEKLQKSRSSAKICQQYNEEEAGSGGGYCASNSMEVEQFQKDVLYFLKNSYFSLHDWVQWFIDSQGVEEGDFSAPAGSFRWRGRPLDSSRLAPNTLASGLDDYPRSQHPSSAEHHVDLLSWIASSCRTLKYVGAALLGAKDDYGVDLSTDSDFLSKVEKISSEFYSDAIISKFIDSLVSFHWSADDRTFYDVGLVGAEESIDVGVMVRCSEGQKRGGGFRDVLVELEALQQSRGREPSLCPTEFPQYMYPLGDGKGGLQTGNKYSYKASSGLSVGFIPRLGYVNIFPLLLKLLPATSPHLEPLLDLISAPTGLWSQYGLRSLATTDLFYQQENAPGDAPYWRGPIWMPINYLALGALKHYSLLQDCPHHERADQLYQELRKNLMRSVLSEYDRTGYFWEIYDDSTGKGMRGHPFSGWTTLVVNIMAELY